MDIYWATLEKTAYLLSSGNQKQRANENALKKKSKAETVSIGIWANSTTAVQLHILCGQNCILAQSPFVPKRFNMVNCTLIP